MTGILRRWLSRIAALALMAALLYGVSYGVPSLLWERYQELAGAVRDEAATLARLNATVAELSAGATGTRAWAPGPSELATFVAGETESVAAASLQTRLNELATANGVRLQSVGSLPVREANGLRLISARVQLTAGMAELYRLLHALETTRPLLLVESIEWRAEGAAGPMITASLDVAGVLDEAVEATP